MPELDHREQGHTKKEEKKRNENESPRIAAQATIGEVPIFVDGINPVLLAEAAASLDDVEALVRPRRSVLCARARDRREEYCFAFLSERSSSSMSPASRPLMSDSRASAML